MSRRATHIASVEAAQGKKDDEIVTVMNPAVSRDPTPKKTQRRTATDNKRSDSFTSTNRTEEPSSCFTSTWVTKKPND